MAALWSAPGGCGRVFQRGLGVRHSGVPLLSPHFAGDLMKFGLIYELSTPRPFTADQSAMPSAMP